MKKHHIRHFLYTGLLNVLRLSRDYRGNPRTKIGANPYPRRSPILLAIFNFQQLFRFLFVEKRYPNFRPKLKSLENSKNGQVALLIGHGPSLLKISIDEINRDNPDIWVINDFYNMELADQIQATHYVLSDRWSLSKDPTLVTQRFLPLINYIKKNNICLFLPHWAQNMNEVSSLSEEKIYFFDDRELSAWSNNISPLRPRGYTSATLYKALSCAIYLGYERIYILGMDNSEFLNLSSAENNALTFTSRTPIPGRGSREIVDVLFDQYHDGPAGEFTEYAHMFGDIAKFKGPIFNLDEESLTTAFQKLVAHPWIKP